MTYLHRLNHHHLYIFWTLARTGSFTNAAKQLKIAQSAVTSQIKQLEEVLKLELIDRTNKRKIELTNEGRRVLDYANLIFEYSKELLKWANDGEESMTSTIRVGAISGLSRNLQYEFLKPVIEDESIKLEISTGDQEILLKQLKEFSLDVILSSHNVRSDGKTSFYSHVLTTSPLIFVVGGKTLPKKNIELLEILKERPLYIPGLNFEIRPELDAYLDKLKTPVRVAGEIDDIALLRIFALRSGAVVALPEMGVKNDIEAHKLRVLGRIKGLDQRFYAITRQRQAPLKSIELMIEQMRRMSS